MNPSKTITSQQALDLWLAGFTIKELKEYDLDAYQLMALESLFYSLNKILNGEVNKL